MIGIFKNKNGKKCSVEITQCADTEAGFYWNFTDEVLSDEWQLVEVKRDIQPPPHKGI